MGSSDESYNEFYDESYNQSYNETFDDPINEIPSFVTYLSMFGVLGTFIIVVVPAMMVLNIIWWTKELHTKHYFFVANFLATIVANKTVRSVLQLIIFILYLVESNSDFVGAVLRLVVLPVWVILYLMTILLPITLAAERTIVIAYPYRYRSIITTKTTAIALAAMWGTSVILTILITAFVPVEIVWPLAVFDWHSAIYPVVLVPRLISTVFIIIANAFLQYQITISNRKAAENQRLGNEEEAKRFRKLVQVFQAQVKCTITLFLVGGIDVIATILLPIMYAIAEMSVDPSEKMYYLKFLLHPIQFCVFLSHPLVYGLCVKKIRNRLPRCLFFHRRWTTRRSRVTAIRRRRARATVINNV